jgi:malonate decarboxylase epsilon subunit
LRDLAQENLPNIKANAITPDNFDKLLHLALS